MQREKRRVGSVERERYWLHVKRMGGRGPLVHFVFLDLSRWCNCVADLEERFWDGGISSVQ